MMREDNIGLGRSSTAPAGGIVYGAWMTPWEFGLGLTLVWEDGFTGAYIVLGPVNAYLGWGEP